MLIVERKMNITFPELNYPFVYLDGSFLHRENTDIAQKLTRKLLHKSPRRFSILLEKMILESKSDALYYEQIIYLQKKDIISTLITFESLNTELILQSPSIIPLFGSISRTYVDRGDYISQINDDLILWEENVNLSVYTKAAMTILNSSCVVADENFLSLMVGRNLIKYITSNCTFCVLKSGKPTQNDGGNHIVYELPPISFIQMLYYSL